MVQWRSLLRFRFFPTCLATATLLVASPAAAWVPWLPPAVLAPAPAPTASPATSLTAQLDALLDDPLWTGTRFGVHVIDLADEQVLYSRGGDLSLNPASNVKLVTTAAALAILGPEHRYLTRLYAPAGGVKATSIDGDLYLRGGGDPALGTADLYQLASNLRALGITKITGGLVLDTSQFDRDELPPGFDQKTELAAYRAPGGALSVDTGTFTVHIRPGSTVGAAIQTVQEPRVPAIRVVNEATTATGRRSLLKVDMSQDDGGLVVTLSGTLGQDSGPVAYRYPVIDPSTYTGQVFQQMLQRCGIKLGKTAVKSATIPKDAEALTLVRSAPLSVLVRGVNKQSNNYLAEHILKTLDPATPQTYAGGLARVHAWIREQGLPGDFRMTNGSGLYDTNNFSARQLAELLVQQHKDVRVSSDYLASLPIAGIDGTLHNRMKDPTTARLVRAKTGTLSNAISLSGYAGAPGKPLLAFALLANDLERWKISKVRAMHDQIATILATHAAARP